MNMPSEQAFMLGMVISLVIVMIAAYVISIIIYRGVNTSYKKIIKCRTIISEEYFFTECGVDPHSEKIQKLLKENKYVETKKVLKWYSTKLLEVSKLMDNEGNFGYFAKYDNSLFSNKEITEEEYNILKNKIGSTFELATPEQTIFVPIELCQKIDASIQ